MMKTLVVLMILALAVCKKNLLVTKEFTEQLKKTAKYEVVDYEENLFKGWTFEEAKQLLSAPRFPNTPLYPAFTNYKDILPIEKNWTKDSACINPVHNQAGCGCSWALTLAQMVGERVRKIYN